MKPLRWGLFLGYLCLAASALLLSILHEDFVAVVLILVWTTTLSVIGFAIASSRRDNPIGWLLIAIALGIALQLFSTSYAHYTFELRPGSLPFGLALAWLNTWLSVPAFLLFIHVFLRFPTGQLLSPRWHWASRLTTLAMVVGPMGAAFRSGPLDTIPSVSNPLGSESGDRLFDFVDGPGSVLVMGALITAILSLFVRMRRAHGTERQQLKLFAYAVALFPVFFAAGALSDTLMDSAFGPGDHWVDFLLIMAGALLIPISIGVAILRYRLYEIDVIINRTLVYAALTALLAGAYLGIVFVLQIALNDVTGDSQAAVAVSTLAVAALFGPLRARVQGFIDRRFYRRKYDARRTLDHFSRRLRDEVDIKVVGRGVRNVLAQTVQPAHMSLWLRSEARR